MIAQISFVEPINFELDKEKEIIKGNGEFLTSENRASNSLKLKFIFSNTRKNIYIPLKSFNLYSFKDIELAVILLTNLEPEMWVEYYDVGEKYETKSSSVVKVENTIVKDYRFIIGGKDYLLSEIIFLFNDTADLITFREGYYDTLEFEEEDNKFDDNSQRSTYEKYTNSYAQDIEGWSDQDIDDVFDGDPDAYWNID